MSRDKCFDHSFDQLRAVTVLAATLIGGAASADSMRCGKWIVNESTGVDELLSKCGQPQSRDVSKEDNYALNPNGARVKTGQVTVRERWIYQPSSRTLAMAVEIVDGKVVSMTRAD